MSFLSALVQPGIRSGVYAGNFVSLLSACRAWMLCFLVDTDQPTPTALAYIRIRALYLSSYEDVP